MRDEVAWNVKMVIGQSYFLATKSYVDQYHFKNRNMKMGQSKFVASDLHDLNLKIQSPASKAFSGLVVRNRKIVPLCLASEGRNTVSALVSSVWSLANDHKTIIHTYSGSVIVLLFISALLAFILVKKFNIDISWEYYWFPISSFIIPIYPLLDFKGLTVPAYTNLLGSIMCPLALNVIKILSSYNKIKAGDLISFKDQRGEVIIGKVEYVGLFSPLMIRDCTFQSHAIFPEKMADACIVRLTVGSLQVIKFKLRVSRGDLEDTIRSVDNVVGEYIGKDVKHVEKDVKHVEKDGETHNVEEMEEIGKEEAQKVDKNMGKRKFICVIDTDISSNSKNVEIIVSFLAKVDDLREYIRMKGDVIAKVSQLLAKAKGEFDERPMSSISRVDGA